MWCNVVRLVSTLLIITLVLLLTIVTSGYGGNDDDDDGNWAWDYLEKGDYKMFLIKAIFRDIFLGN